MGATPQPGRPRRRRRWASRWPALVWLGAAAAAILLYRHGDRATTITGVVDVRLCPVAPMETARLVDVSVSPGETVAAGAVVARLDPAVVDASIALVRAELAAEERLLSADHETIYQMRRQFATAVGDARAALDRERQRKAEDQAELTSLAAELQRLDDLLAKRLIPAGSVGLVRARVASLQQRVNAYPAMLKALQQRLDETVDQAAAFERSLPLADDADVDATIREHVSRRAEVARQRLALLELQKDEYTLRTPVNGTVSRVWRVPGEVVPGGERVVTIVDGRSRTATGFLRESVGVRTAAGQAVAVSGAVDTRRRMMATITGVDPRMRDITQQISSLQRRTIRGQLVHIRLPEDHGLVPGEAIRIDLNPHGATRWWRRGDP